MKNYFEFGLVVQEEVSFKDMFIWSSASHFVQQSRNICAISGRGHYEEQFYEFSTNLGQWFCRSCCLKKFFYGALAALVFCGVEPFM